MEMTWYRAHRGFVRLLAVVVPPAVGGGLHLLGQTVANSAAALVLVLLVVACAATGDRIAGVLASVTSAISFDFFLTTPYFQLRIDDPEDLQLAVLLLVVGVAVSELASWGIRESSRAAQQAGFVHDALESADLAAGSIDQADALERVSQSIRRVLGVDTVTFEPGDHDAAGAVINRDGTLRYQGRTVDVALTGLPRRPSAYTAIPVTRNGAQLGYFRVETPVRDVRPTAEQLRVAVLLAAQWSLRAELPSRRRTP